MRILISGSDTWPEEDIDKVENVILEYVQKTTRAGDEVTFIYADNPTGISTFIPKIALKLPLNRIVAQECYLIDWDKYGKTAPNHTNRLMASKGADICMAFFHNHSRYVYNCLSKVESAGICIRRFNHNSLK